MHKLLFSLVLFLSPSLVSAASFQVGDVVEVEPDGNSYAAGSLVQIAKEIRGDAFLAGEAVQINADISEDVFIAGENITINGKIGDDLHAVGSKIIINNSVIGDVIMFGQSIMLSPDVHIKGESIIGGQDLTASGKFNDPVRFMGKHVVLNGTYFDDVKVNVYDSLEISEDAKIYGNLHMSIPEDMNVVVPENVVRGEINRAFHSLPEKEVGAVAFFAGFKFFSFFSRLIIGGLIIALAHRFALRYGSRPSKTAKGATKRHYSKMLLIGLVSVIVLPIVGMVLLMPVITIPIAIITFVLWGTLLYVGNALSGFILMQMIFPPKKTESQFKTFGRFTLGTFVLFGLGIIPVVGFLIGMAISLISFGTLIMFYKEAGECLRKEKLV
ncbi:hypothetical protein HOF56_01370 [Candidatus Peribacteria bacterium]|jgi:hypothetical protein|nr:hypothetical protein [Candidatus Peribacteria bacterium]MBT4020813.1 hypothetical protein [Candidatus Peribacteria bacterium]MBT4241023.1 hypothetical protein [Candidatus Peribacteria bacterium]MBT4474479.1 hypothetical protein [Candidatus Peribacteria bacterium]